MIVDHDLTLRLKWGADVTREITVPVQYRKGSYSGRYELYIDDVHIGWVVKYQGRWDAFLVAEQNDGYQQQCAAGEPTREYAITDVVFKLADHARTNVLASRAAAAYADGQAS